MRRPKAKATQLDAFELSDVGKPGAWVDVEGAAIRFAGQERARRKVVKPRLKQVDLFASSQPAPAAKQLALFLSPRVDSVPSGDRHEQSDAERDADPPERRIRV